MRVVKDVYRKWEFGKKLSLVRQTEKAECGVACLAMIADWYGYKIDLRDLRAKFGITHHGMSFKRLIECGESLNLHAQAKGGVELHHLKELATPCILHWDSNHFVVLKAVKKDCVIVHDPARGECVFSFTELNKHFTGVVLELTPTDDFKQRDESKRIKLSRLIGKTHGLKRALGKILVLAIILEGLALLLPIMNQVVIDEVLVGYDEDLLVLVILGILLITAAQLVVSIVKEWATALMSVDFNMQWLANVFHHLFRLPIDWFEKREIGDIAAKFDAVGTIQHTLTTSVIQAFLDLILVLGTLSVMMFYSPLLSCIAMFAAILYIILRMVWYGAFKRAEENTWETSTKENSYFLETINGLLSLRVNGALNWRENIWRNLNIDRRNAQLHEMKLGMVYSVVSTTINSLVSAAVLWFGANLVISGDFSIGMLVAYLSYQGRFSGSVSSLIDKFFEYKMLSVYNERLADIVLTEREFDSISVDKVECFTQVVGQDDDILQFQNVSYSYAPDMPLILNSASFDIKGNEVVALVGESGCGKSTVSKLILKLYQPTTGNIIWFGNKGINPIEIRSRVGVVLQDDSLFGGSIIDNITLSAEAIDEEWMYECAQRARVHEDISRLNMGYHTLLGEQGGGLSGGQKQRILIARALYKKPNLLILDEATSHLDIDTERFVCSELRSLNIPTLMIAHRPDTIAAADRVLLLQDGLITELVRNQ
ncbi:MULTISPECIES: peptidase domain-containing ABC transporter [Vibrio harveyi group]|uniref:peptidase domain-containing ABC transporter n=1 Tax=Vibrio harveyi group TaxID=717610 RepID=UPI00215BA6AF|nr:MULTISPECIES: peptidase domain-containing ABC transporter [Vibrio harveyi group]MCR9306466.1 peptidase domain-containing ABC transporter [Vibrio diabolicus]WMO21441.1 peptidase domain-containing ABC transporter [Vibrio alginolyticus]